MRVAIAHSTAQPRNVTFSPTAPAASSTPAIDGPTTRMPSALICPSETAFVRSRASTSSAVNAMRAGANSANAAAWMALVASSIQYSTASSATAMPIHSALNVSNTCDTISTVRFG